MNVVICDDDIDYLHKLEEQVAVWKERNHKEEVKTLAFRSSEDLMEEWNKGLKADVFFLDILFESETNGMELAWTIRQRDERVMIVFITTSEAYAKKGYSVQAFRYLSKPICYADLALCLDVSYRQYTLAHNEYLILTGNGSRMVFRFDQITYIEARSPYTEIHMIRENTKDIVKIRGKLHILNDRLPTELFVQCHRSYIVNILYIQRIQRTELFLLTGESIPVSRSCFQTLCSSFDRYYQEGSKK